MALTALTLEYTELISGALATAYSETQRDALLQADRDRRDLLERTLLGTFDLRVDGFGESSLEVCARATWRLRHGPGYPG